MDLLLKLKDSSKDGKLQIDFSSIADPAFYELAVYISPLILTQINPKTDTYAELALAAVSVRGEALEYVSPETEKYREIALAAVKKWPDAIKWVPAHKQLEDVFRRDAVISLAAVKRDGLAIRHIPVRCINYEIAWAAVKENGMAFKYLAEHDWPNLWDYREFVFAAVTHKGEGVLKYIDSSKLQADYYAYIAAIAVHNDPLSLEFVDERCFTDEAYEKMVKHLGGTGAYKFINTFRVSDRTYYQICTNWAGCDDFNEKSLDELRLNEAQIRLLRKRHEVHCSPKRHSRAAEK